MPGDKKRCETCGEIKHITEFDWNSGFYDNRSPTCRSCKRLSTRQRKMLLQERAEARMREAQERLKESQTRPKRPTESPHALGDMEVLRQSIVQNQKGVCPTIARKSSKTPRKSKKTKGKLSKTQQRKLQLEQQWELQQLQQEAAYAQKYNLSTDFEILKRQFAELRREFKHIRAVRLTKINQPQPNMKQKWTVNLSGICTTKFDSQKLAFMRAIVHLQWIIRMNKP